MEITRLRSDVETTIFKTAEDLEWFFRNLDGTDVVITEGGIDRVLLLKNDAGIVAIELLEETKEINDSFLDWDTVAEKYFRQYNEMANYIEVNVKITYEYL